jgi:hypothetical protein
VALYINGAAARAPAGAYLTATADASGETIVDLQGLRLQSGGRLTATQKQGPDTSDQSRDPEVVLPAPANLGPPVFACLVAQCADWARFDGVVPGCTVEVEEAGQQVGAAVASGTSVSVRLDQNRAGAFGAGKVFAASQSYSLGAKSAHSSKAVSLPVPAVPPAKTLPSGVALSDLTTCDTVVRVGNVLPGATTRIRQDAWDLEFPFVGPNLLARTPPLTKTPVTASQRFEVACHLDSPDTQGTAADPQRLPKPIVQGPICAEATSVICTNLRPGATVALTAKWPTGGQTSSGTFLGRAQAAGEQQALDLPLTANQLFHLHPGIGVYAYQEGCGKGSADSDLQPVGGTPGFGHPQLGPMTECGHVVFVSGLVTGNEVRLLDSQNLPLSAPVRVFGSDVTLTTYRPLVALETVTLHEGGCGNQFAVVSRGVDALGAVGPPVVRNPLRAWTQQVTVDQVVAGARVHVFVNGQWRGQADASDVTVNVPVGPLHYKDQVTAAQMICTKATDPGARQPVSVTNGRLVASAPPMVRGPAPQSVTVSVRDGDDGHLVPAQVWMPGGIVESANVPFSWTFPVGQPDPPAIVRAGGYDDAPVVWHLQDPPPQTALLTLILANPWAPTVTVSGVDWSVYRGSLQGPKVPTTGSSLNTQVPLPKPLGGADQVYGVSCTAHLTVSGARVDAALEQIGASPIPPLAAIGWTGAPLTASFLLETDLLHNADGNEYQHYFVALLNIQ